MKILAPIQNFSSLDRVRGNDSSGQAPKRDRGRDPESKQERPEEEPDFADIGAAALEFSEDPSATANGLQAEVEPGQGPGLRVTLKDGRGAVVRQFTGEEFLRLREAASGAVRGRLLDKKL